jgi:hypothetical protein
MVGTAAVAFAAPSQPKSIFPNPNTDGTCDKNQGLCQTDNRTITYYSYASLDSAARGRVDAQMTYVANNTVFTTSKDGSPTLTGTSETDFVFAQDASKMPNTSTVGITLCDDPVGTLTCDQTYMYFRSTSPDRPLICHESGHAAGLTHGEDAYPAVSNGEDILNCLQDPASQRSGYNGWGPHNESWIDYTY